MQNLKILVAISAYNSGEKIIPIIAKLKKTKYDVLITDDKSTDSTPQIISKAIHELKNFTFIAHKKNKGIGYVLREQIRYARKNNYQIIVVQAGNGKDNPSEISKVVDPILKENFDYIQGSRFLDGGSFKNLPLLRKIMIRTYTLVVYLFTGFWGTDATNGFRAYRLSVFDDKNININQDWLDHYEFETYLHYKVTTLGYKVKEVAVSKNYIKKVKKYSYIRPFIDWWVIMKPLFLLKFKLKN